MKLDFYPLKNKNSGLFVGFASWNRRSNRHPNVDGSPKAELDGVLIQCAESSSIRKPEENFFTRSDQPRLQLLLRNRSLQDFGCKLPYLLRFSPESPLSPQVHPSLTRICRLYKRKHHGAVTKRPETKL